MHEKITHGFTQDSWLNVHNLCQQQISQSSAAYCLLCQHTVNNVFASAATEILSYFAVKPLGVLILWTATETHRCTYLTVLLSYIRQQIRK